MEDVLQEKTNFTHLEIQFPPGALDCQSVWG